MENKEYPTPILVTESKGMIHISYDQISLDFPTVGPVPEGAPDLAYRIFELFRRDLCPDSRAE
jgi:hypothetical protein